MGGTAHEADNASNTPGKSTSATTEVLQRLGKNGHPAPFPTSQNPRPAGLAPITSAGMARGVGSGGAGGTGQGAGDLRGGTWDSVRSGGAAAEAAHAHLLHLAPAEPQDEVRGGQLDRFGVDAQCDGFAADAPSEAPPSSQVLPWATPDPT
ncbi:hypothetical protein GCM10009727_59080 [Actinomadura napierensis]|uniref:Uncharacterized protein n=1 Tax=Actinomadura napierensis TaxID=267854 RepID=A0ABP5LSC5_9ACTN